MLYKFYHYLIKIPTWTKGSIYFLFNVLLIKIIELKLCSLWYIIVPQPVLH